MVQAVFIEVTLEEIFEGGNEPCRYLVGDRTASSKALRQKWVCPAHLRYSKESSVNGLSKENGRQGRRGSKALQVVLRTVAFTLSGKWGHYRVSTRAVVLNRGVILHPGDIWQCLVVMNWEGMLLASSG